MRAFFWNISSAMMLLVKMILMSDGAGRRTLSPVQRRKLVRTCNTQWSDLPFSISALFCSLLNSGHQYTQYFRIISSKLTRDESVRRSIFLPHNFNSFFLQLFRSPQFALLFDDPSTVFLCFMVLFLPVIIFYRLGSSTWPSLRPAESWARVGFPVLDTFYPCVSRVRFSPYVTPHQLRVIIGHHTTRC